MAPRPCHHAGPHPTPTPTPTPQLLGEAARNSRLLHAGVAYLMVVGYGGLNSSELGKVGSW